MIFQKKQDPLKRLILLKQSAYLGDTVYSCSVSLFKQSWLSYQI